MISVVVEYLLLEAFPVLRFAGKAFDFLKYHWGSEPFEIDDVVGWIRDGSRNHVTNLR